MPPLRRRPSVVTAMPDGGDSSVPLAFESDVELRTMAPELDHVAAARRLERLGLAGG